MLASLAFSLSIQAAEYLSLNLGSQNYEAVIEQLKQNGADFQTDYGYKGYLDLPIIKVTQYSHFNKHGRVKEAWLYFTEKKALYKIEVTWHDSGSIKTKFKDALDSKYGRANAQGMGFNKTFNYKDKNVQIQMLRNEFGFGDDQTTGLTYTYQPALKSVAKTQATIDAHIRKQNAASVSNDL